MRLAQSALITTALLLSDPAHANKLIVGDGQIDGARITPYELTWYQCMLHEGSWVNLPPLTERLDVIDGDTIRLTQNSTRPDGGTSRGTTLSDLHSFAPQKMEFVSRDAAGTVLGSAKYQFDKDGYRGQKEQAGKSKEVSGALNSSMLNAMTMGLPLATLPWQDTPLTFTASMINFDGTYDVIATWTQEEKLDSPDGEQVKVWLLDIEWHHRESGDVYPPGPDSSGGRYWVVPKPTAGMPAVLRYKTDTYAVEFNRKYCPEP